MCKTSPFYYIFNVKYFIMLSRDEYLKLLNVRRKEGGLYKISEKEFKEKFPELYNSILECGFPEEFSFKQKLYHYLHNDDNAEIGFCECGKRCTFLGINLGYSRHCCVSCSMCSAETQEKARHTSMKHYGVDNPSKSDKIREKVKQTNMERYGVDSVFKMDSVKEKKKQTMLERYGVENPLQVEEIKEKVKQTNLERYGAENVSQSKEIQEKRKLTFLERFGVENSFMSEKIRNKSLQTIKERYGVEHPLQSDEIKEKIKKTNLERYGVEYTLQSVTVKNKGKETVKKKYGVENVSQSEEIQEKKKKTNLKRFGVEYASQSEEIKERIKQTNLKNNGVEYPMQSETIKKKRDETCIKKYGVSCPTMLPSVKEKAKKTNLEKYGVEWCCIRKEALNHVKNSKVNQRFGELLAKNNIGFEIEHTITKCSYDFKIGDTLVEVNPSITHNTVLNVFGGKPLDKNYHVEKSNLAREHGFSCIHVWDWDNVDAIIGILRPKERIGARNCEIKTVGKEETDSFLNDNHLQGKCNGVLKSYGLYYNGMLVELMVFGKPRYNRNYEWELLRLCSHKDYLVVGGANKLLERFKKENRPESVISYCDLSKFSGDVYDKLGFSLLRCSNPTKHWWDGKRHITDNLLRQRGFDQLFGADYGKGTSNEELMLEHGFLPVYDCGQATYVWCL